MADPVQAIEMTLSAIKAGAAIARWWEQHESSRERAESSTPISSSSKPYRQSPTDLLYIMATLGERMLWLRVINKAELPAARATVREAFRAGDTDDEDMIGDEFDKASREVQFAITCGMAFSAECWPVPMWRGYGAGVFNYMSWADPARCNIFCDELDNSIAALKAKPHAWKLLTKSPAKIGRGEPFFEEYDKADKKMNMSIMKDLVSEFEKRGFPQPLPPYDHIKIMTWYIPFATWVGKYMHYNCGHDVEPISTYQLDPGRFLWAWTAGRHTELRPCEAALLTGPEIADLALWLEGLHGMKFRVLRDSELDYSKIKLKSSTKKFFKKQYGNENGISGEGMVIVIDHKQQFPEDDDEVVQIEQQFQKLDVAAKNIVASTPVPTPTPVEVKTAAVSSPATEITTSPTAPVRRRPVPMPPAAVVRRVVAIHNFASETDEELSFSAGDTIDVLNDKSDDGWWKARIGGKTGIIPSTFVK